MNSLYCFALIGCLYIVCTSAFLRCHYRTGSIHQAKLVMPSKFTSSPLRSLNMNQERIDESKQLQMVPVRSGFKVMEAIYKFSRPHTIKGTVLASAMGIARAISEHPKAINSILLSKACLGVIALLCGNAYIVGINQIYDVQVDKINKPYLPLAANSMSQKQAWVLILSCLACGLIIVRHEFSSLVFVMYTTGIFLGTIYSVPPFQFKRIPILAGTIIAFVRGFLLNFGVYYAVRESLSIPFQWNPMVLFISIFMTVFALVIAITKDMSDVVGDARFGVRTLATTFGIPAVALAAFVVLSASYITAMIISYLSSFESFHKAPMVLGHMIALGYLCKSYAHLDSDNRAKVIAFYRSIWNLFYWEYLLYPFM